MHYSSQFTDEETEAWRFKGHSMQAAELGYQYLQDSRGGALNHLQEPLQSEKHMRGCHEPLAQP